MNQYICKNPNKDAYCNNCKHSKPHEKDLVSCDPICDISKCNCKLI